MRAATQPPSYAACNYGQEIDTSRSSPAGGPEWRKQMLSRERRLTPDRQDAGAPDAPVIYCVAVVSEVCNAVTVGSI